MEYSEYLKTDTLALNLLVNVENMKKQLRDAFTSKMIDNEFYSHMRSCVQTLELSIRGFKKAQEWAYKQSGGEFYQRPMVSPGILRNGGQRV